jgi:NAD-dependent dihydropyrimidine dehydrogenase PreA subunit
VSEHAACSGIPGRFAPVVDRNRCDAKADCVRVCPYNVFEIGRLSQQDKASMSLLSRLKSAAHKNRQAFVVNPDACHACNLCVDACPEKAITLAPFRLMH